MYLIFLCEWGAGHEPWMRERPEEYGGGARGALLIPAVDYLKAQRERRTFQVRAAEAMKGVDLLVSPTYPIAQRSHRGLPSIAGRRLAHHGRATVHDALRSARAPAVSLPGGFAKDDAPVGIQIAGRAFQEARVLRTPMPTSKRRSGTCDILISNFGELKMADLKKRNIRRHVWEDEIVPTITEYISIPNVSPMFDRDWQAHGHMDRALELAKSWVEAHQPEGSTLHVGRLENRTPLLLLEIQESPPIRYPIRS